MFNILFIFEVLVLGIGFVSHNQNKIKSKLRRGKNITAPHMWLDKFIFNKLKNKTNNSSKTEQYIANLILKVLKYSVNKKYSYYLMLLMVKNARNTDKSNMTKEQLQQYIGQLVIKYEKESGHKVTTYLEFK